MSTAPLVSVLIPAYNAETTVESALASVLRQSLREIEIVLVDDGSTDSTVGIAEGMCRADERLRLVRMAHGGIINALNSGIEYCRADLIARMDADDISHPRRLEAQAQVMLESPDVSVCSCLVRMFPRRGLLGGLLRYEGWLNSVQTHEEIMRDMFVESPVAHPSVMLRRTELVDIGGYEEHGWPEDYDLWLRYHAAGKRFCKVEETLLCWRQSEGRLTFTDGRYSLENFIRAKAHYISRMLAAESRPVALWGAGMTGRRLLKHLTREGVMVKSVIDVDPRKIGSVLRGLPIVGTEAIDAGERVFIVAAVGSARARELIRDHLTNRGFRETVDFICAA